MKYFRLVHAITPLEENKSFLEKVNINIGSAIGLINLWLGCGLTFNIVPKGQETKESGPTSPRYFRFRTTVNFKRMNAYKFIFICLKVELGEKLCGISEDESFILDR